MLTLLIASFPELQCEQIIEERLEYIKKVKEMPSALALANRRTSEVVDEKDKMYVPHKFRSPDYHSIPFFKDSNDEEASFIDTKKASSISLKETACRTYPCRSSSISSKQPARRTPPPRRSSSIHSTWGMFMYGGKRTLCRM